MPDQVVVNIVPSFAQCVCSGMRASGLGGILAGEELASGRAGQGGSRKSLALCHRRRAGHLPSQLPVRYLLPNPCPFSRM